MSRRKIHESDGVFHLPGVFLWRLSKAQRIKFLRRVPGRQACVDHGFEDLLSVHCWHICSGGVKYVHGLQRWTVLRGGGIGMRQLPQGQEERHGGEFLRGVS